MKTVIKQNAEFGYFEVLEGSVLDNEKFYNGRFFGLNSHTWVNEKPITNDPTAKKCITVKAGSWRYPEVKNVYEIQQQFNLDVDQAAAHYENDFPKR